MNELQIYITMGIFVTVILVIAFDLLDLAVATLLGVCALIGLGILGEQGIIDAIKTAGGPLSLLFGGMVVAHTLGSTGLFERVGAFYLRATRGSGKRFLLLLILIVAPICALLPNATTVVLLAPVIVRVSRDLEIDFVRPLILTAIVSNAAGMLTLVGDPATFLVGNAIGMTFGQYLVKVSLGGLLSLVILVPLLPLLMPDLWRLQRSLPPQEPQKPLERPAFAALSLAVLAVMVALFLIGESLPTPIVPPAVAIIGGSLALLVIYSVKAEPVEDALGAVDWKTLVFLGGIFCLVQAVTETGLLQALSLKLNDWFGTRLMAVSMALIAGVGALSSLLANTPVVAASILMIKGYLVAAEMIPETGMGADFTHWPAATIPVFVSMMFGATLGGNATLIGASANVVAAGICAREGRPVSFICWLRYGLPITAAQLVVGALYVLAMFQLVR